MIIDPKMTIPSIAIYICIPDYLLKKAKVPIKALIGSVLTVFNENSLDFQFIYDGHYVNGNSTFEQIKIIDNDVLLAVKKQNIDINIHYDLSMKFKKLQRDHNFETKLKMMTNKNIRMENSRLLDVKHMKIEGNHKLYKKKTRRFIERMDKKMDNIKTIELNLNYKPLVEPSNEAIPVFW